LRGCRQRHRGCLAGISRLVLTYFLSQNTIHSTSRVLFIIPAEHPHHVPASTSPHGGHGVASLAYDSGARGGRRWPAPTPVVVCGVAAATPAGRWGGGGASTQEVCASEEDGEPRVLGCGINSCDSLHESQQWKFQNIFSISYRYIAFPLKYRWKSGTKGPTKNIKSIPLGLECWVNSLSPAR
jgi:hypothetical protein